MPSFNDIQLALEACMAAEPPKDYVLSKDSSLIADVWAEMLFTKEPERPLSAFSEKSRDAYLRWSGSIKHESEV